MFALSGCCTAWKLDANQKRILTLEQLNERIKSFDYRSAEFGNKAVEIPKGALTPQDGHIKQSAAEMWCLLVNLPLMIDDLIPHDEQHWELFLSLLDIMSIVFAPSLSQGATYYLRNLISDHLETFTELFSNDSQAKAAFPSTPILSAFGWLVHLPSFAACDLKQSITFSEGYRI